MKINAPRDIVMNLRTIFPEHSDSERITKMYYNSAVPVEKGLRDFDNFLMGRKKTNAKKKKNMDLWK